MKIPPDIQRFTKIVRQIERIPEINKADKERLNFARLRLAMWACECEGIRPTRTNLRGVLLDDADEALEYYHQILQEGPVASSPDRPASKPAAPAKDP